MFETKKAEVKKRKTLFYNLTMGYWIVLSLVYFGSLNLALTHQQTEEQGVAVIATSLMLAFNLFFAYLLYGTEVKERSREGLSGLIFKFAIVQQLIVGNIFGAVLAFFAHLELPESMSAASEDEEKSKPIKGKHKKGVLFILAAIIVLSLGIAFVNWRVSNAT